MKIFNKPRTYSQMKRHLRVKYANNIDNKYYGIVEKKFYYWGAKVGENVYVRDFKLTKRYRYYWGLSQLKSSWQKFGDVISATHFNILGTKIK